MNISVDIKQIRDHIVILNQEKQLAESLVDELCQWRKQMILLGGTDTAFLDYHINIAKNQVTYVRRRITLLESVVDDLSLLVAETQSILSEAKNLAKRTDSVL